MDQNIGNGTGENPPPNKVIHEHHIYISGKEVISAFARSFIKIFIPPILLGGAIFFTIETKGACREINWLVPGFAGLCAWAVIF